MAPVRRFFFVDLRFQARRASDAATAAAARPPRAVPGRRTRADCFRADSSQAAISKPPRRWNSIRTSARAMAASQAATVKMKITSTWPSQLLCQRPQATRLTETPCSIISAHRNMTIMFRRLRKPTRPMRKQRRPQQQRILQQRRFVHAAFIARPPDGRQLHFAGDIGSCAGRSRSPWRRPAPPAAACRPLRRRSGVGRTVPRPVGPRVRA